MVFAKTVDGEDHSAYLDLPAGVYVTRLVAKRDVELSPASKPTRFTRNPALSRPFTCGRSWTDWEGESLLMERDVRRVGG
ncbi:MAG: hypothetical protein OXT70_03520 [Chloroflexota bacterium]|nr:hypothetical protein [Chloroflexota bacterium]